jgi:hypothetical protein
VGFVWAALYPSPVVRSCLGDFAAYSFGITARTCDFLCMIISPLPGADFSVSVRTGASLILWVALFPEASSSQKDKVYIVSNSPVQRTSIPLLWTFQNLLHCPGSHDAPRMQTTISCRSSTPPIGPTAWSASKSGQSQ